MSNNKLIDETWDWWNYIEIVPYSTNPPKPTDYDFIYDAPLTY